MNSYFDNQGKRIGIFVIAYNAEAHIDKTLSRIPSVIWDAITKVYVIDDCSHDETVRQAVTYGNEQKKMVVLRNRVNQRYGGNQKVGYQYAIDNQFDAVVMLHADGQYAPECLAEILAPIVNGEADVVMGSRMMERGKALVGGMPTYKYFGNKILTTIQNCLTGLKLSEFHSGYRAYSVEFLKRVPFWQNSDEWHFDTQIILQAAGLNARIREVPIPTYYGSEICHVNGILYALNCIRTSLSYWLYRNGLFYRREFDLAWEGSMYREKFSDPHSSHSQIKSFLKQFDLAGCSILEFGVGDASITKWLHAQGAAVDVVEVDEKSAAFVRPFCRHVIVADLDDIASLNLNAGYDFVLAADVLEHLRFPELVLSHIKCLLKRKGVLVVSLPNVANLYVRANLFFGRFPYYGKGILDNTHLHFYTVTSARWMLNKTGWSVVESRVTPVPWVIVFPFLAKRFRWIMDVSFWVTKRFKGLLGYQALFFCENPNHSDLL
jgi:glycosyltransferase involved in cell wall biosynthesis